MRYADWTDARNTPDADVLVCRVRDNNGRRTCDPSRDVVIAEAAFAHDAAVALVRSGGDVTATLASRS